MKMQPKQENNNHNNHIKSSTTPLIDLTKFEVIDGKLIIRKDYLSTKCNKKKCKNCKCKQ